LGVLADASESERVARSVPDAGGTHLVPAFAGLGAPYWRPDARGIWCGITRGTTRAHLVRAALESIAYQSADLVSLMRREGMATIRRLRVDGGATRNDFLMQFQADLLGVPLERPAMVESTALGAAYLAGIGAGVWRRRDEAPESPGRVTRFRPKLGAAARRRMLEGWAGAVARIARDDARR
jgi:glycerol kinase